MGKETVIALIQNQRPVKARRVTWYKDPGLKRLHGAQKKVSFDKFQPGAVPETPRSGALWSDLGAQGAKQGKASKEKARTQTEAEKKDDAEIVASSPKVEAIESPERRTKDQAETSVPKASDKEAQNTGETPIAETGTSTSEAKADLDNGARREPVEARSARSTLVFRTDLPNDENEHRRLLDRVVESQKRILDVVNSEAERDISEDLETYAAVRKALFKDKS